MKRAVAILVFVVLSARGFAQDETRAIDSLENAMAKQEGGEKVETMMELSKAFLGYSFDDCIHWGEKAIGEATQLRDEELMAKAYWKLGLRYLDHFEFDLAYEHFVNALCFLENKGDSELLMRVLNTKGRVELFMGNLDSAMVTYQRDLAVSDNISDELNHANVLNNIAYIHFQQNDLDRAMECFQDARRRFVRLHDTLSVAQCDNNISNVHIELQQFTEAQLLLQAAIPVFEHFGDDESLAHAYQNLGTIYATGHVNLDLALFYLRKSIDCAQNVGDQITLIEDEFELANVLKHLDREKETLSLYQSALHSSETIGYIVGMLEACKNLGIRYNETGDYSTSAVYLKRCMNLASKKGNNLYINTIRPYLIADYARLGQLMEMKKELGLLYDNYMGIVNENNNLSEELTHFKYNADDLLAHFESQNQQIERLQTQRNRYRLAFFGMLALAVAIGIFAIILKIVRKNQSKNEKA